MNLRPDQLLKLNPLALLICVALGGPGYFEDAKDLAMMLSYRNALRLQAPANQAAA